MARLALILQLLILITWTHVYAAPGPCSGACHVRDPALIQRASDGKYFRFSTGNKIAIASASDLSGPWKALGSVVPGGSSINLPGRDDLWVSSIDAMETYASEHSTPPLEYISYFVSPVMYIVSFLSHHRHRMSKKSAMYIIYTTPYQRWVPNCPPSASLHQKTWNPARGQIMDPSA